MSRTIPAAGNRVDDPKLEICNVYSDYRWSTPASVPQMLSKLPSRKT